MSMEEAARWQPDPPPPAPPPRRPRAAPFATPEAYRETTADFARTLADKKARDEAIRQARLRGLDAEETARAARAAARRVRASRARRDPWSHAAVLLKETSLPFSEIADITGLDIYGVVGLKLKLRKAS
jgi:hypothetical protein